MIEEYALVAGILAACFYGLSAVLKKIVFNNSDFESYNFTVFDTLVQSLSAILLALVTRQHILINLSMIGILSLAGLIYGVSIFIYNFVINKDEASRASQLASLETIITPLFAVLLLNEMPTSEQITGIVLIVIGIIVVTVEKDIIKFIKTAKFAVLPIFMALIMWGMEDVLLKYTLETQDVVFVYFWVRITSFLTILTISVARSKSRGQVTDMINNNGYFKFEMSAFASLVASIGLILTVYTYSLIDLSVASPVVGSYPIFAIVFLYIAQYNGYVEEQDKEPLTKRVISAILFLSGIFILT